MPTRGSLLSTVKTGNTVDREQSRAAGLLASTNRVEAPFVRVNVGGYTFGVYEKKKVGSNKQGVVSGIASKYPNYIQWLEVKKINGTVNQYKLHISYPITENNDPNFFDKLFSTVSADRKITIDYGDATQPDYIFRDEEGIITKVGENFGIGTATIDYDVEAVSASTLTLSGSHQFITRFAKPSDVIKQLLRSSVYKLTDVFTGMKNMSVVEQEGFIAGDDAPVLIPTCNNMSILEYIALLVAYMKPVGSSGAIKSNIYSLSTYDDTSGKYGGPYFKVEKIQKAGTYLKDLCSYEVDVGYPSANIVKSFQVEANENWSIYYNYSEGLDSFDYKTTIDAKGNVTRVYSPQLKNTKYTFNEDDSTWWTKVTEYPVKATLVIKGLLRPTVLMQYIKLNMLYFGHRHIASGYYIITSQVDRVDTNGFTTTLKLLRVAPDDAEATQWS